MLILHVVCVIKLEVFDIMKLVRINPVLVFTYLFLIFHTEPGNIKSSLWMKFSTV